MLSRKWDGWCGREYRWRRTNGDRRRIEKVYPSERLSIHSPICCPPYDSVAQRRYGCGDNVVRPSVIKVAPSTARCRPFGPPVSGRRTVPATKRQNHPAAPNAASSHPKWRDRWPASPPSESRGDAEDSLGRAAAQCSLPRLKWVPWPYPRARLQPTGPMNRREFVVFRLAAASTRTARLDCEVTCVRPGYSPLPHRPPIYRPAHPTEEVIRRSGRRLEVSPIGAEDRRGDSVCVR